MSCWKHNMLFLTKYYNIRTNQKEQPLAMSHDQYCASERATNLWIYRKYLDLEYEMANWIIGNVLDVLKVEHDGKIYLITHWNVYKWCRLKRRKIIVFVAIEIYSSGYYKYNTLFRDNFNGIFKIILPQNHHALLIEELDKLVERKGCDTKISLYKTLL